MSGEGSSENTLEFGGKHPGEEEEELGVENDGGNKRIKKMPIVWFDLLPDSLLIHILSFLSVKEAAITCVLSKTWEFLWTESPRLVFTAEISRVEENFEKVRKFVYGVNKALATRRVNYLDEFVVSSHYYDCFDSDVDAWVKFAVENKVKKLDLDLDWFWSEYYTMPNVMYSCPSLTHLHVRGCFVHSETTIVWPSLTHLHIQDTVIYDHFLEDILASCPVLHNLFLEDCSGFDQLWVKSPSIRSLSIVDAEYESLNLVLELSAPYIHSLYVSMLMEGRMLLVENVPSLVRADLDYTLSGESSRVTVGEVMCNAKQLLESLHLVKELHLGLQFIEFVSMMVLTGWQLPHSTREILVVASASEYNHHISCIVSLLESSPNLETLVIKGRTTEGVICVGDAILESAVKDDMAFDLLHLKTVKFRNFESLKGKPILTLVRILLKRATALEEMTIMTDGLSDCEEMVQAMLSYPKSSTKAVFRVVK